MLLYIDPGTGSMIFTLLLGLVSVIYYLVQSLVIKAKHSVRGGRSLKDASNHIPYVIYTDSKRYWNVFKPICDIFEKNQVRLVYWTSSPDDPGLSENYEYVERKYIGDINKAVTRLNFMNAGICLSTTPGLGVYQWKRSKNVMWYAHIGHALGDMSLYRMFGLDFYDAVFLTAGYQEEEIRTLEKLRGLPEKDIPVAGLSYMDTMRQRYDKDKQPASERNPDNLTVLLAPSWGKSSILSRYGSEFIESLVNTGFNIIIRPHPQSLTSDKDVLKPIQEKFPENDKLKWNYDNDNYNVLSKADIMISDFSGVIFDYALVFDRPVIYADTSYDNSPYDACWLDRKPWIFESLPKIGVKLDQKDFSDMKRVILDAINNEQLKIGREEVRKTGWQNIGACAETVAEYMQNKYAELFDNGKMKGKV